MRNYWPFALIILASSCLLLGSTPQQGSSIEGAWKLVHATVVRNGALAGEFPESWSGNDMKMWSHGHFTFVGRMKSDTTYTDYYGGGKYTLQGNRYQEEIEFHMVPGLIGTTAKMLLEVRSDTLIQTWPVKDDGQIDKDNFYEEKYVRLD